MIFLALPNSSSAALWTNTSKERQIQPLIPFSFLSSPLTPTSLLLLSWVWNLPTATSKPSLPVPHLPPRTRMPQMQQTAAVPYKASATKSISLLRCTSFNPTWSWSPFLESRQLYLSVQWHTAHGSCCQSTWSILQISDWPTTRVPRDQLNEDRSTHTLSKRHCAYWCKA